MSIIVGNRNSVKAVISYQLVDEIGKMELFSAAFREAVLEAVEGGKVVLGTIMSASHPWADIIKGHPAVLLLPVSEGNRETLPVTILDVVQRLRASKHP